MYSNIRLLDCINKPKDVIDTAIKLGLSGIAITDHECLSAHMEINQYAKEIKEKYGIDATLINPRFVSGIDTVMLEELKQNHTLVITLENGVLDGGFGEKISRFYSNSDMKVLNYGAKKEFTDRVPLKELYQRYHLTKELITKDVSLYLK